jgi:C-terminal processing protease CtpA/Prc
MRTFHLFISVMMVLLPVLSACSGLIPTAEPQLPQEYLENALNWIQTHAVLGEDVDWTEVKRQAFAMSSNPRKIADTYPAIRMALQRLNDGFASLDLPASDQPNTNMGLWAISPQNIVITVDPVGPAAHAGVQVGDVIELINGSLPKPFLDNPAFSDLDYGKDPQVHLTLHRAGQTQSIEVVVDQTADSPSYPLKVPGRRLGVEPNGVSYIELPPYSGYPYIYPGLAHELIRNLDRTSVCGWIIDVRRNGGGNLWSYLAAIGPILGEGDVGGFLYADGTHELWSYRDGKVFWAGDERDESLVQGGIYKPKRSMLPVALLTGPATIAAGELVLVAFEGRQKVRTFGEPTRGLPTLSMHTPLSDGAQIFVSGAFGTDRNGNIYKGPILPDESVKIDWAQFGTDQDPVILAAMEWLKTQLECKNKGN